MRLLEFETANNENHAQPAASTKKSGKKQVNQTPSASPATPRATAAKRLNTPSSPTTRRTSAQPPSTMTATAPAAVAMRADSTATAAVLEPADPQGQVLPMKPKQGSAQPIRRQPIDLEQLQQRIEVLERRMRDRARAQGKQVPVQDLDKLKQRMQLLERTVHNELWAAKQREHTLLEMLARPSLKQQIYDKVKHLHCHTLPATRSWFSDFRQDWWDLNQPVWWEGFARAWQESLDKARGNNYT